MSTITTRDGTQIYFKDWGPKHAQPLVFHHGWPLSADDWDNQMLYFVGKGYRVVAHDRRGHGRSTQSLDGNEKDTYADDLAALIEAAASGAGEVEFAREAEFEKPLNERRMRYRRLTLVPRLWPEE